jgi:signal transduction histidine kinase
MPDARTADTDRDVLAIALHLERILTQLLALARGERSELPAQRERVQLAPLVENVCRKFQDKAAARRLSFAWHVPDQAETDSDAVLLRSILAQLVDNAVEYTPPGGAVELEARLDGGRLAVRVSNSVDTLEPGDLPRLFEPFWRKDAARAVDGHTGLGLSVAQTFAHALGCNLTAAFAAPGRLAITLAQAADDNIR